MRAALNPIRQELQVSDDFAAQALHLLWQDEPKFTDEAAQAVVGGRAFGDEPLARAMQAQHGLLADVLDWHEAHVGPCDGFADGRGVRCIVLATLTGKPIRRYKFGCHQPYRMAVLYE